MECATVAAVQTEQAPDRHAGDVSERPRDQWLLAGQTLLRRGGIKAVKLGALTAELGLTTGSFYHHFGGMAEYLDDLARFYGADQVRTSLADADVADPVERLRHLVRISRDDRMAPLDAAMRDWAGSNELAANAVRATDEQLLQFVERAFRDLGHDEGAARARALLLISAGVARVVPPWPLPEGIAERILEILS